jgi:hypothetical protein
MNYYPEQILENINSLLKHMNSDMEKMCYKLNQDPIELPSSIFTGSATMQTMGSVAEYLNMPIEALFSDTLDIEMQSAAHKNKYDKQELEQDRKLFSAFALVGLIQTMTEKNMDSHGIEVNCTQAVQWADGLIKVLKEKK